MRFLKIDASSPYEAIIGVGGIGTGCFFKLEGDHTLGRNESRPGQLLDVRDYCKLHIVTHYIAKLVGSEGRNNRFHVVPVGKVGDDAAGESVLQRMQEVGIDTRFVSKTPGKPTLFSVCFQYPDDSGGNITTSNSAAAALSNEDVDAAVDEVVAPGGNRVIALSVPEVPLLARRHFLSRARQAAAFCVASFVSAEIAAAKELGCFELLDLLAVNQSEAAELMGTPFSKQEPEAFVEQCLWFVNDCHPDLRLMVSAGNHGVYGFARGTWNFCPAPAVAVASTAGAGDALLSAVIAAIAAGIPFLNEDMATERLNASIATALEFGVLLASYKVTSPHTIHPGACLDTLVEFAGKLGVDFTPEFMDRFSGEAPTAFLVDRASSSDRYGVP